MISLFKSQIHIRRGVTWSDLNALVTGNSQENMKYGCNVLPCKSQGCCSNSSVAICDTVYGLCIIVVCVFFIFYFFDESNFTFCFL